MELPSSRFSSQQPLDSSPTSTPRETSNMATLTMRAPSSMLPSPRDMMWNDRSSATMPSRPRSRNERIELPSIRQAIPELDFRSAPTDSVRKDSSAYSPTRVSSIAESSYVSSPSLMNKRRRLSAEDETSESRDYSVPRIYRSPRQTHRAPASYSPPGGRQSQYNMGEQSNRASPYDAPRSLPSIRTSSTSSYEQFPLRNDFRPNLPSLPSLTLERTPAAQNPTQRPRNWSDYALDTARVGAQTYPPQTSGSLYEPPQAQNSYPATSFGYGYPPPRGQSYSGPSSLHHTPHERSPFTGPSYHHGHHEGQMYDMGIGGTSENSKQRKRRGNLPKETTDKLRAWFVAHLQHPYPTEDEKQDLMRQTGLQMNQISNWFINARRRQLPAMINNARAESDARSARSSGDGPNANSLLLGADDQSGSEGGYDEDYEGLASRSGNTPVSAGPVATSASGSMSVEAMTLPRSEQ